MTLDRYQQVTRLKGKWTYDLRLNVELPEKHSWENVSGHKAWVALKQKRIDAVLETETAIYIFEVKKQINFAQFGQLLTYEILYRQQFKTTKPIQLVALAAKIDNEIAAVMKQYQIYVTIA